MSSSRPLRRAVALLLGIACAAPAAARITCCEVDGKRVCGDPPPAQCLDKAKTVFDKGVAKAVEAPLTAEQKAARDAAAARKAEEEKKAAEQARRDRALLDSYGSEKDIDQAQARAIAEIEKNAAEAQARLDGALKKRQKLEQEQEFYAKKKLPAQLAAQIKDNQSEIAAQQQALQAKDAQIAETKARFDADKLRLRALQGK